MIKMILGSDKDSAVMADALKIIRQLSDGHVQVNVSVLATAYHQEFAMVKNAAKDGFQVIIVGSHMESLPGILSQLTHLPVIGVPISHAQAIDAVDVAISNMMQSQRPGVWMVPLNDAAQAGMLALEIMNLLGHSTQLKHNLHAFKHIYNAHRSENEQARRKPKTNGELVRDSKTPLYFQPAERRLSSLTNEELLRVFEMRSKKILEIEQLQKSATETSHWAVAKPLMALYEVMLEMQSRYKSTDAGEMLHEPHSYFKVLLPVPEPHWLPWAAAMFQDSKVRQQRCSETGDETTQRLKLEEQVNLLNKELATQAKAKPKTTDACIETTKEDGLVLKLPGDYFGAPVVK